MLYKIFFLGLTVLLLNACGSSADTPSTDVPNVVADVPNVVADVTAPVISITVGTDSIVEGTTHTDAGATATDAKDGTVTVTVENNVDANTAGTYTIVYSATDVAGNTATKTRTVTVSQAPAVAVPVITPDTVAPVITLIRDATVTLTVGDVYVEQGASALDNIDGNITDDINTTSTVDTDLAGTYTVKYNVSDSAGNVAVTVTRTVTVTPRIMHLKKTGQTKSFDASGVEVTDGSLKDDGFYQKGREPSYSRDDATDIVTDHVTNLQWADDTNVSNASMRKRWLTTVNYDICRGINGQTQDSSKCTDTSGDTATTYCTNLTLGGQSDWRLPSIDELMYIADRSKRNPAIDIAYFQNVVSDYYWSSTTVVGNEYGARLVFFYYGSEVWDNKSASYHVRCVRDGQ